MFKGNLLPNNFLLLYNCLAGNIQDCKHNTVSNIFTSEVSVIQQNWHIFQEKGRNNKAEDAEAEYDEFNVFECDMKCFTMVICYKIR